MDDNIDKSQKAQEIGKQIYLTRKKLKISREKLAEESNISTTYVYDIETGKKVPNVVIFFNICNSLGISPDAIFNPHTSNRLELFIKKIYNDFCLLTETDEQLIINIIHDFANIHKIKKDDFKAKKEETKN